ncbi:bifunctional acetate--CoA ligase family protein/GNAT family N-acetyltransferase [Martelella alba]|uniref:Bifunctional acetate--CoA ligase family protein/GNAT family N-acetyltransferase n=1 Tax=Martelella alba TaxID=2590451 RepID=A0ABY2SJB1_9HYPH|nr:bifunctional acetate--CoA ligase family protein/GNAT family N-acetyltransferase [Martelella alba]TKI05287.1 bifunctional acetate--CoA ligase family protein/GNAT family N-acetyltransferase [Martelella alba]
MSQKGLEALLRPKSIAVLGASDTPGRAGYLMMRNLLAGGFRGPVLPVTPKYAAVCGVLSYPEVQSLPLAPDLAVICTHARRNPELLEQLGRRGCKTVVILSSPPTQFAELKACAHRHGMRLLGPNSLGVLSPAQGLNASFSPVPVPIRSGRLAFISQSAAVANTILDWAQQRAMGFSYFVALGDSLDIDVDDVLDFLARDSRTSAILLHLEHLNDARRFLSAARGAARNKPILVIKSGRTPQAQHLLNYPQGRDAAYDAAIQRAGLLRVRDTHELFSAVETLSHMRPLRGERLMIVSNGVGPAALALDELLSRHGRLATLGSASRLALQGVLPAEINAANPLNLGDDADPARYRSALSILLDSRDYDAILIIHAPSAASPSNDAARQVIELFRQHPRGRQVTVLTNWSGEFSSQEARRQFTEAGLPTYRTAEGSVIAFMHMAEYRRNQKQLLETPAQPTGLAADTALAHQLIRRALEQGLYHLATHEIRPIVEAYGLATLPTWIAGNSAEAVKIADEIGYPVALKLRSPDIAHKSDVQGVMLSLRNAREVAQAADAMVERVAHTYPRARIEGMLVQSMANRAGTQELRIRVEQDPVFGPVILMGESESDWRQADQTAVALPPLNMALAHNMVLQGLKKGAIRDHRPLYPLDVAALSQLLVKISTLLLDCPEIEQLDIHPLLACGSDMTLLDISLTLAECRGDPEARLAIRPYPQRLETTVILRNGESCLFRPILPEDEPLLKQFIGRVTPEDLYYRYFSEIAEFTHEDLAYMTQIDYDREMAFVAVKQKKRVSEILGVTRVIADPDNTDGEFAVLVRSDLKKLGLGRLLLEKMIGYARGHGLQRLTAITMPSNQGMITLAKKLGFTVKLQLEDGIAALSLELKDAPAKVASGFAQPEAK